MESTDCNLQKLLQIAILIAPLNLEFGNVTAGLSSLSFASNVNRTCSYLIPHPVLALAYIGTVRANQVEVGGAVA